MIPGSHKGGPRALPQFVAAPCVCSTYILITTIDGNIMSFSNSSKSASLPTPWISSIRPVFCFVSVVAKID